MSTHSEDLLKIVATLDTSINEILQSKTKWYEKVGLIVEKIVPQVETIGNGWSGSNKKQLALELIEDIWFRHFDSKYIPNFLEKMLVDKIASICIDKFVALMNKTGVFKHA